jgi:hypothetical protein
MGYKGDALKSQFKENKFWERQAAATVMGPQTCKRQEAIATTHMHGKKFFVAGGKHVTFNNMFKVSENNR